MSKMSKITAFAAPAIMALAVAAPSEAKILLMGDGGWEVSFDGSVNSFYNYVTQDELSLLEESTNATHTGSNADGEDTSRITVGLLPAVWGMNIKAPTTNGLDMSSRIGLYPSTQNNRRKNTSQASSGGQNGGNLDLREIFFAVESSAGKVLVGRTLGLYQGKNILTDMTLFGVGAGAGSGGGTTLGRIGWGYVYPNFNAGIRYTTPSINGTTFEVGIFDPSTIGGGGGVTETALPRVEMEFAYAGTAGPVSISAWANGMFQKGERSTSEMSALCSLTLNGAVTGADTGLGAREGDNSCSVNSNVYVGGGGYGLQLGYAGLTLTGSGYNGRGLGTTLMIDTDALDAAGHARVHDGWIGQGTYAFGQGSSIGASYGVSKAKETTADLVQRSSTTVGIKSQSMWDFMAWHDINKNLRVVAEYGVEEREWHDGANQEAHNISMGGFFFW